MLASLKPIEGSPELFVVMGAVVVIEGEGTGTLVWGELHELEVGILPGLAPPRSPSCPGGPPPIGLMGPLGPIGPMFMSSGKGPLGPMGPPLGPIMPPGPPGPMGFMGLFPIIGPLGPPMFMGEALLGPPKLTGAPGNGMLLSFGLFGEGPIMCGAIILFCWPCIMFFIMFGYLADTF